MKEYTGNLQFRTNFETKKLILQIECRVTFVTEEQGVKMQHHVTNWRDATESEIKLFLSPELRKVLL